MTGKNYTSFDWRPDDLLPQQSLSKPSVMPVTGRCAPVGVCCKHKQNCRRAPPRFVSSPCHFQYNLKIVGSRLQAHREPGRPTPLFNAQTVVQAASQMEGSWNACACMVSSHSSISSSPNSALHPASSQYPVSHVAPYVVRDSIRPSEQCLGCLLDLAMLKRGWRQTEVET